jgi:hypothetical protein
MNLSPYSLPKIDLCVDVGNLPNHVKHCVLSPTSNYQNTHGPNEKLFKFTKVRQLNKPRLGPNEHGVRSARKRTAITW